VGVFQHGIELIVGGGLRCFSGRICSSWDRSIRRFPAMDEQEDDVDVDG
jgi:hypothetical protein